MYILRKNTEKPAIGIDYMDRVKHIYSGFYRSFYTLPN